MLEQAEELILAGKPKPVLTRLQEQIYICQDCQSATLQPAHNEVGEPRCALCDCGLPMQTISIAAVGHTLYNLRIALELIQQNWDDGPNWDDDDHTVWIGADLGDLCQRALDGEDVSGDGEW